jgi:ABC-type Fe3+-siderophore transport system permease subunit
MNSKATESKDQENWKPQVLIVGAVLGALVGVGAAYLISQQAERSGKKPEMSAGAGIRLGLLVLGLLRQVAALGDGD